MRVSEHMTRKVVTATPDDGVRETFFRMRESGVRHLPVLDGARLVGMLSDRDLRRPDWVDEAPDLSYPYELDDHLSVGDLMTRHPICIHGYERVSKAARIMAEQGFGALPVLDKGGHLVGILTKADLVDDPEWLDLVTLDISEALEGTVLEDAPIVPVSARTGKGIDELAQAARDEIEQAYLDDIVQILMYGVAQSGARS